MSVPQMIISQGELKILDSLYRFVDKENTIIIPINNFLEALEREYQTIFLSNVYRYLAKLQKKGFIIRDRENIILPYTIVSFLYDLNKNKIIDSFKRHKTIKSFYGIKEIDLRILKVIKERKPTAKTELAKKVGISVASLYSPLSRLLSWRLIEFRDGVFFITEKGNTILESLERLKEHIDLVSASLVKMTMTEISPDLTIKLNKILRSALGLDLFENYKYSNFIVITISDFNVTTPVSYTLMLSSILKYILEVGYNIETIILNPISMYPFDFLKTKESSSDEYRITTNNTEYVILNELIKNKIKKENKKRLKKGSKFYFLFFTFTTDTTKTYYFKEMIKTIMINNDIKKENFDYSVISIPFFDTSAIEAISRTIDHMGDTKVKRTLDLIVNDIILFLEDLFKSSKLEILSSSSNEASLKMEINLIDKNISNEYPRVGIQLGILPLLSNKLYYQEIINKFKNNKIVLPKTSNLASGEIWIELPDKSTSGKILIDSAILPYKIDIDYPFIRENLLLTIKDNKIIKFETNFTNSEQRDNPNSRKILHLKDIFERIVEQENHSIKALNIGLNPEYNLYHHPILHPKVRGILNLSLNKLYLEHLYLKCEKQIKLIPTIELYLSKSEIIMKNKNNRVIARYILDAQHKKFKKLISS